MAGRHLPMLQSTTAAASTTSYLMLLGVGARLLLPGAVLAVLSRWVGLG